MFLFCSRQGCGAISSSPRGDSPGRARKAGEHGRAPIVTPGSPAHEVRNAMTEADCRFLHCSFGGAERERTSKSRMPKPVGNDRRPSTPYGAPPSAAAFPAVLEFEVLSRIIASKQSMKSRRCGQRRPARLASTRRRRPRANAKLDGLPVERLMIVFDATVRDAPLTPRAARPRLSAARRHRWGPAAPAARAGRR